MKEEMLFKQLDFYRYLTLSLLDSVDEETADFIPESFNNSIRWHLGHVYVAHENIAIRFAGEEPQIPDTYKELFEGGTKPAEWKLTPPSLAELREILSAQPERTKQLLQGKLEQATAFPFAIPSFIEFHTVAETFNFALYHEGQHTGFIKALIKAVKK